MHALPSERYLASVRGDAARIRTLADAHLPNAVPACPGWTVDDLVRHLAEVYLRQAAAIAAGHRVRPGDPTAVPHVGEPTLGYFDRGLSRILSAIEGPADAAAWTWGSPSGTLGFWQRRMAQESLIHRVDIEQAVGCGSTVEDDLAVDGIDEVLTVFLPLALPDEGPALGLGSEQRARVEVLTAERSWKVHIEGLDATVTEGTAVAAAARVCGDPAALLLWAWGRAGDEAVVRSGSEGDVAALRRCLAAATQ